MRIRTKEDFERLVLPGPEGRGGEEGLHLDFKNSPDASRDTAIDVAAFANSAGGALIFGVAEDSERPKFAGTINSALDVATVVEHVEQALTEWTYGFDERPRPLILTVGSRERVVVINVSPAGRLISVRGRGSGRSSIAFPFRHEHGNDYLKPEEVALRLDTRRGFATRGQLREWLRTAQSNGCLIYLVHLTTPGGSYPDRAQDWDEARSGQVRLTRLEPEGARLSFGLSGPSSGAAAESTFTVPYDWIVSVWWNGDRPAMMVAATLTADRGLVKGFPRRW